MNDYEIPEEVKEDLFDVLNTYHARTGKGVEIAEQFIDDLYNNRVDGRYYLPEISEAAECGCFHHSALVALGKIDELIEVINQDGFPRTSASNNEINRVLGFSVAGCNGRPFETWLFNEYVPHQDETILRNYRWYLYDWLDEWIGEHDA